MEESSDKATSLKKAYAEMILNTAKESAATVMFSDRNSARFHHDLCETKDEALRLLVRLKQMIDAKTIEAEITSSNQQRQIDVLEAQLQEAEDIITDLRSELRWVRDKLEKAMEGETISSDPEVVVVVASLNFPNQDMSESLLNQSLLNDDECGGNDDKSVEISKGCDDDDDACESELDANISNKKLELSRNGCTQRICDFETKSSSFANDKNSEENLNSGHETGTSENTRCLVLASLHPPNQDMSDSLMNQSSLHHDECGGNEEKACCESELDANIRNKKFELSRNGCTQRIHALESKLSPCVNEDEQRESDKKSGENLSSGSSRCLVLALRAKNAEVIIAKPSNALGIKKSCKLRGRRKRKWSKGKAKPVRSSQLIKPCQSQSDLPCSKTFMENSDGMETDISVENEEADAFNACKGLEEHLQNITDHMVEACQKSNLVSVNVEDGAKTKPLPHLNPIVSVNETNGATDKDLKLREEAASVKCEGEEKSVVVPSTKLSYESKATAVVSSESPRAEGNRIVKYTFQRKRKRDL